MNPESDFANPINTPSVWTVSALNNAVARLLERNLALAWVSGEISNFTRAASGHWYFTLKDNAAQVRAVMFRGRAQYADFQPKEGDKVEVRAQVTLYAPRGDYQLSVEAIRRAGLGDLYEAFLRLKAQLGQEGLFDAARKRALPHFVRRIGIVTSPQAAALRDVLTTLRRRAAHVEVILYPAPVQGEGAGEKIAAAIATAAARNECDVLLLCRGGGSMEDLWAFNEEIVARTLVHCPMPVIAGIGHETDFTIADFAADLRAPTPTAAAELATPARADWLMQLGHLQQNLQRAWQRHLASRAQSLDWLAHRLPSPAAMLQGKRQLLVQHGQALRHAARSDLQQRRLRLEQLQQRWRLQRPEVTTARLHLDNRQTRLEQAAQRLLKQKRQQLTHLQAQLELLNPQRTLERGYAIVTGRQGELIRASKDLHPNSHIRLRLAEDSAEIGIASVQTLLQE